MPLFKQQMIETRTYDVTYYVEAKDEQEATEKLATGDTVRETETRLIEIVNRDSWDEIAEVDASEASKLLAE